MPPPRKKPRKKAKSAKSIQTEVDARVAAVLAIRLDGAQFHDIVQYAAGQGWGVSERQLWNYVKKADERLRESRERSTGRLLTLHLARRESLYARAVNAGEIGPALAVLKDQAHLLGLYPDPKLKDLLAVVKEQDETIRHLRSQLAPRSVQALEAGEGDAGGRAGPDSGSPGGDGDSRPEGGAASDQAEDLDAGSGI